MVPQIFITFIAKNVSTSGVQHEEHAIFRAQELDLIYAQAELLYVVILNAPRSNFDPKVKPRPHADGIVGSRSTKIVYLVVKQVSQLSINQSTTSSQPTQSASVLSVQSLDQKGNQQPGRNKKKGKNNRMGGNKNKNANFNDMNARNAGGGASSLNVR